MLNPRSRSRIVRLVLPISMALTALGAHVTSADDGTQWPVGGQDLTNTRYQAKETTISRLNVGGLTPKWVFTTGGYVSATPTVVGGALYVPDRAGNLYKLDAGTGALIWSRTIASYSGVPGDTSRTSPAVVG